MLLFTLKLGNISVACESGNGALCDKGGWAAIINDEKEIRKISGDPASVMQSAESRIEQAMEPSAPRGPITRSQTKVVHPIGTIIRKKFNKTWYEGEMTNHPSACL